MINLDIFQSAYKIFDPSRKNGTIDIPVEPVNYRFLENYCSTLAHKTNHSFLPNAEFVCFDHPKYGVIPCLTSNHDIQPGTWLYIFSISTQISLKILSSIISNNLIAIIQVKKYLSIMATTQMDVQIGTKTRGKEGHIRYQTPSKQSSRTGRKLTIIDPLNVHASRTSY